MKIIKSNWDNVIKKNLFKEAKYKNKIISKQNNDYDLVNFNI